MAKMLIGGESVDSVSKETYEVRNPATGAIAVLPGAMATSRPIGTTTAGRRHHGRGGRFFF